MDKERLRLRLAGEVDGLFAQGVLIHVTDVQHLEDILLRRGLLSPCLQAQCEGKVISEDTPWHPQDNLFVKFLKLPSPDPGKNIGVLKGHFWQFAHPEEGEPIGVMVDKAQAVKLFKDFDEARSPYNSAHFYGIRDFVPPQDILGIIIFTTMIVEDPKRTLRLLTTEPPFISTTLEVMRIAHEAEVKLGKRIRIFEDLGREIFPAKVLKKS